MKSWVLGLASLFLVTSCGSSLEKLSAEQKTEVQKTLSELGRPLLLAKNQSGTPGNGNGRGGIRGRALTANDQILPAELAEKMNNCDVEYNTNLPGVPKRGSVSVENAKGDINFVFSVKLKDRPGVICPVDLTFDLAGTGSNAEKHVDLSLKAKYLVKDEAFRNFVDVTGFDFTGTGNAGASNSGQLKAAFDSSGQIVSRRNGSVELYLKIDGSGQAGGSSGVRDAFSSSQLLALATEAPRPGRHMSCTSGEGNIRFGLKFEKFTAEMRQSLRCTGGQVVMEYFVNDEAMNAQEFASYMEAMTSLFKP